MILFQSDWAKYPSARPDLKTRNKSFLRYAYILNKLGVENNAFHLALYDQTLVGVDPNSDNLTLDQQTRINMELQFNPWYYFREVAAFKGSSNSRIPYRADRATISLLWTFFNHIDYFLVMMRQRGKSGSSDQLHTYINQIAGRSQNTQIITKDNDLRKQHIQRLKDIRSMLPAFVNTTTQHDADNSIEITNKFYGNHITIAVARANEDDALKAGRGFTSEIFQGDEVPFIKNAHHMFPSALGSTSTARANAAVAGAFFGNIFTTTAGKLDTPEGKYAYKLLNDGMYWNEKLYDCTDRSDVISTIKLHAYGDRVLINGTFSYIQLGVSPEELREIIANVGGTVESINRDFFNVWSRGSESHPIYNLKVIQAIKAGEVASSYIQKTVDKYLIDWYYEPEELTETMSKVWHVISIDSSSAIGSDRCGLVITSTVDAGVKGKTAVSETSLLRYAQYVADLMIQYPKTILVIENKSSGQAILDIVSEALLAAGIDPFKRIYSRIIGELVGPRGQSYKAIQQNAGIKDYDFFVKNRGDFGFMTTAGSRKHLYDTVLRDASLSVGHLIKDSALIQEIMQLTSKNGRVDHPAGGHDDLTIAWLMGQWFLRFAPDLHFYGITGPQFMSQVTDSGALEPATSKVELDRRKGVRAEIAMLKEAFTQTSDVTQQRRISLRLTKLATLTANDGGELLTINSIKEELAEKRKVSKPTMRERLARMRSRR